MYDQKSDGVINTIMLPLPSANRGVLILQSSDELR